MRKLSIVLCLLLVGCFSPELTTMPATDFSTQPIQTPTPPIQNAPTGILVSPSPIPDTVTPSFRTPTPEPPIPTPGIKATAGITEISQNDVDILARLCWVEVRGYAEVMDDACLSVVSTVLLRMSYHIFSDGTVIGTVGWNCTKESQACQFPAYVIQVGCDGIIPALCPGNSPSQVDYFKTVVWSYFLHGKHGSCEHYLYYGIQPFDQPECVVKSSNGSAEKFHTRIGVISPGVSPGPLN